MKKNFKIIQVHGIRGLIMLAFVASGLISGFLIFPVWAVMKAWNYFVGTMLNGPIINCVQSGMLWLLVLLSAFLLFKHTISVKVQKDEPLNPDDVKKILQELKTKDLENKEEPEAKIFKD